MHHDLIAARLRLEKLDKLAEEIGRSMKFGVPLPSGTTEKWGERLREEIAALRKELGFIAPLPEEKRPVRLQF